MSQVTKFRPWGNTESPDPVPDNGSKKCDPVPDPEGSEMTEYIYLVKSRKFPEGRLLYIDSINSIYLTVRDSKGTESKLSQSDLILITNPDLEPDPEPEDSPEVDYWDNWTYPAELTKAQKDSITSVKSKEIAWGDIEIERDTIPDPELNLTPECYLFYQLGYDDTKGKSKELIDEGYGDCYEDDFADTIEEIRPLIDAILTRSDFDTFDPVRLIAETLNVKYQGPLSTLDRGNRITYGD